MPTSHWRAPPSARSSPAWRVALSLILLLCAASPAAARFPRRRISRRLVATDTVGAVNATATASPPGKPHQEPSPLQGPPGTTDEDCRKHPGLCQPMACELWRDDIKDRCRYVRDKDACGSDDHLIHYLEVFYCPGGGSLWPLMAVCGVVWMLLLFYGMSVVAEVFLCPAVEYISVLLRLSPDIAGITVLAFASGAPDIFTELAAINGGNAVEVELAVSSVVGSGLFICSISLAAVILVSPVEVKDRIAFIRDMVAYFVACAVTLELLWDGKFSAREAGLLVGLYFAYLLICISTSKGNTQVHRRFGSAVAHHAVPSDSPRASAAGGDTKLLLDDQQHSQQQHPRAMELVRVSGGGASRLQRMSQTGGWSTDVSPSRPSNGLANGWHAAAALVEPVDRSKRFSNPEARSKPGDADAERPFAAANGIPDSRSFASELGAEDWDLLDPAQQPPDDCWYADAGRWLTHLAQGARATVMELLHLGRNPFMNAAVIATAPLVLLMHATMPALTNGRCSRRHCLMLSLMAPAFMLLVAGALRLGVIAFVVLYMASAGLMYAVMYASFLHCRRLGVGYMPRANAVFAVLAFVQSVMWLSQIADEVVALFQAIGNIFSVGEDLLGATVLAWGETFPDLMAMIAVSRAGQSTMAVAACFGGPVLNLLLGTGVPVLVQNAKIGTLPFRLSNGITILFACSMALLLAMMVGVPLSGWRMSKRTAWSLLSTYVVFQILFILAEEDLIFRTPFNQSVLEKAQ